MNNYNQFKTTVLQPPIESKQYVSVVYNQRLAQHGITASTGTVGDWYDNALAENVNGSYKNELIHTRRWNDVVDGVGWNIGPVTLTGNLEIFFLPTLNKRIRA